MPPPPPPPPPPPFNICTNIHDSYHDSTWLQSYRLSKVEWNTWEHWLYSISVGGSHCHMKENLLCLMNCRSGCWKYRISTLCKIFLSYTWHDLPYCDCAWPLTRKWHSQWRQRMRPSGYLEREYSFAKYDRPKYPHAWMCMHMQMYIDQIRAIA